MITKTLKTGFFIIAVASFSFVGAQEKVTTKKHKSEKMFQQLDKNSDNLITLEEFKSLMMKDASKKERYEKRFAELDSDKNGTLDREEYKVAFGDNRKQKSTKKVEKKKG
tara:strand:- start:1412 stop:1741 length:330 start_codon:yes stop_codon:yes gene_type:complete